MTTIYIYSWRTGLSMANGPKLKSTPGWSWLVLLLVRVQRATPQVNSWEKWLIAQINGFKDHRIRQGARMPKTAGKMKTNSAFVKPMRHSN